MFPGLLLSLLINALLIVLVIYIILWVLQKIGLDIPARIVQLIWIIVALIILAMVVNALWPLGAHYRAF